MRSLVNVGVETGMMERNHWQCWFLCISGVLPIYLKIQKVGREVVMQSKNVFN